ncbi:g6803 [Coccomyxa elongata]
MDPNALNDMLKGLLLKDLRIQCRARGVSPAGSREALMERIKEHMIETQDFTMKAEGTLPESTAQTGGAEAFNVGDVPHGNNYGRPEGQNVGNFLTDRPSSRVLAAPGGASQIFFGEDEPAKKAAVTQGTVNIDATGSNSLYMGAKHEEGAAKSNNYGRPEGQNVGNFLTDRSSSRVLAPPGGASQIFFG